MKKTGLTLIFMWILKFYSSQLPTGHQIYPNKVYQPLFVNPSYPAIVPHCHIRMNTFYPLNQLDFHILSINGYYPHELQVPWDYSMSSQELIVPEINNQSLKPVKYNHPLADNSISEATPQNQTTYEKTQSCSTADKEENVYWKLKSTVKFEKEEFILRLIKYLQLRRTHNNYSGIVNYHKSLCRMVAESFGEDQNGAAAFFVYTWFMTKAFARYSPNAYGSRACILTLDTCLSYINISHVGAAIIKWRDLKITFDTLGEGYKKLSEIRLIFNPGWFSKVELFYNASFELAMKQGLINIFG